MAPGKYKVLVDDNYHYMDESHRYSGGSFDTPEEALEICAAGSPSDETA